MNHLYAFTIGERRIFVVASSWKAARNLLLKLPQHKGLRLPQLSGKRISKNVTAEIGVVSIDDVFSQMAWWTCKCGNTRFISLDNGTGCRCTECGRERRLSIL